MAEQDHVVNIATRTTLRVDISDADYAARQHTPTDAERAAKIVLPRTTMEPVLTAALQAGGANVTLVSIGSYIDGALAASSDLTADEAEIGRWLFKSAVTFHRGDPEVVIASPETTAAQLLEKCAAVFGFGAGGLGDSPTWAERVAAASPALDTLFLLAEARG